MITHISEKETQLVSMLRKTGEALDACTAERDEFKIRMQRLMTTQLATSKERDTYQVAADRLAWENKALRDALTSFTKSVYIKKQHPKRYAAAVAALQGEVK